VGEVYQYVMHKTKHVIRGIFIVVALKCRKLTEASSFRRETRGEEGALLSTHLQ